jgi:predicted secreted hydrolase
MSSHPLNRRTFIKASALLLPTVPFSASAQPMALPFATVTAGPRLQFPRDHGAHPDYRTEWWYLTGLVESAKAQSFGFQCTFFRSSTGLTRSADRLSHFTPSELIMAHFAVTRLSADANTKSSLEHIQRIARVSTIKGRPIAFASRETTDVNIRDWRLRLTPAGYDIQATDPALSMKLSATPTQPILLQGEKGFSRKGPLPNQTSYYYSQPQMQVAGQLTLAGTLHEVKGRAWLDHEWSTEVMSGDATGWDWLGMNLDDGGALMAFRMRSKGGEGGKGGKGGKGGDTIWSAATYRSKAGETITLSPEHVTITPQGSWQSAKSNTIYPAQLQLTLSHPRLQRSLQLVPLKPDQEVDARATTGTIYWEGATELREAGKRIGAGYLEMTGYWKPIQF